MRINEWRQKLKDYEWTGILYLRKSSIWGDWLYYDMPTRQEYEFAQKKIKELHQYRDAHKLFRWYVRNISWGYSYEWKTRIEEISFWINYYIKDKYLDIKIMLKPIPKKIIRKIENKIWHFWWFKIGKKRFYPCGENYKENVWKIW